TVAVTHAGVNDVTMLGELLHGEERAIFGDRGYWKEGDRQDAEAHGVQYRMNRRGTEQHPVNARWKGINRARSRIRAHVEHPFLVVKRLWGFEKVRYRGLAKNLTRAFAA